MYLTSHSSNSISFTAKAYQVEITDAKAIEDAINDVVKEFNGRLDVFVANAGIPWIKGLVVDAPIDHYREVVGVDLDGTFYCAKAAAQHWRRQKEEGTDINGNKLTNFTYGSFVATASISGHIVNFPHMQAVYNASKAAVIHLCKLSFRLRKLHRSVNTLSGKSLSVEWVRYARINAVSPGYFETDISSAASGETKNIWRDKIPMGREGQVHELKGAYLYLASDASSYTTGTDLIVDGGYCAP